MNPNIPQEPPVVKKCIKCSFDYQCFDRWNLYADWCDHCFADSTPKERFPATTPEEIRLMKERQEKTRQSLKQRALDKKNKVGKTTSKKKDRDDDLPTDDEPLIFNETGD